MHQKQADRRNVFKLSGNMALGGGLPGSSGSNYKYQGQQPIDYNHEDISAAKNSLQLLKAKQQAKRAQEMMSSETRNQYQPYTQQGGNSYSNIKNNDWREAPTKEIYDRRPEQRRPPQPPQAPQPPQNEENYSYSNSYNNKYGKSNTTEHQQRNKPAEYAPVQQSRPAQKGYNNQNSVPKQKPIAQLKKEQKVDIEEYDPKDFVECSAGCGRRFNPDSIDKHEKVCKKVFQSKRKEFNTLAQRVADKDQIKLMNKGKAIQKKLEQQKKNEKMPKWKAESLAFRAVVQAKVGGPMDAKQQREVNQALGLIKCQFCGRQFNETAGKRHIPFCQEKSKKEGMKKKR